MRKYVARGILLFLVGALLLPVITVPTEGSVIEQSPVAVETIVDVPTLYPEFQYTEHTTSNNCLKEIEHCKSYIKYLTNYDNVENEVLRVQKMLEQYLVDYDALVLREEEQRIWGAKMEEYPEATRIWRIMYEEFGWSEIVCAGIMGNMMAEVAGGTLGALNRWDTDCSNGFGLIQWLNGRKIAIKAKYGECPTLEQQLYFMRDEMFGTNGVRKQVTDAQLNAIMNANTPEQVAYNFARYFERCAYYSYSPRRGYARIAYDYFVD